MNGFLLDCRFVARGLANARAFSAAVVLTLALGTGATTVMFSVLRATLWRPPPFPNPERLVLISLSERSAAPSARQGNLTNQAFEFVREHASSFERVGAYTNPHLNVGGYDQAERIVGEVVSSDYFGVIGVSPRAGRGFRADEDSVVGAAPVVVVSHGLWQRRFGADPAFVGERLLLNRVSLLVVGIMPPGFRGLSGEAELWIPRAMAPLVVFPYRAYSVVARLGPGRTPAEAGAELQVLGARIAAAYPDTDPDATPRVLRVTPLTQARVDASARGPVLTLFAAVGMLLLIACANIANLLLVRAHAREREVAVRLALGSSRWRLARLLLAESLVLSVLGGAAGLALAYVAVRAMGPLMPPRAPGGAFLSVGDFATPHFDLAVLAFSWLVVLATGVLFGLVPAVRGARTEPVGALKAGGRAAPGSRWRRLGFDAYAALTVGEIALAVVLLAGAGLLLRSLWRLESSPLGFETRNMVSFQIQAPGQWVPPLQAPVLVERVVNAVASVPGVRAAAGTYYGPFDPGARHAVRFPGESPGPGNPERMAGHHYVTPGYFKTLGIPLRRGRVFTAAYRVGRQPVAVLSEGAARRLWPDQDPLGKRFFLGGSRSAPPDSAVEVIGVVGDVRYRPTPYRVEPDIYTPYYQFPSIVWALVIVRSETPAARLIPALRDAVRAVDPDLPISEVRTLEERGGNQLARRRLNAGLLSIFAGLALAIATVGVYGVIAHQTAQRTREFGIRIAVGAAGRDVLRVVLARAVVLIVAGLGIGVLSALALTRVLASQLYEVRPADPATFVVIGVVLAAAALVASYLPARRAARAEPLTALRIE